ncbi:MAG: class I SAM-dependent methyltransferase, partial [Sedimenticola sp.]
MKCDDAKAYLTATELEIIDRLLPLENTDVLELGCGRAWMTRLIAEKYHPLRLIATEVDRTQHQKNLQIDDLPGVTFVYGGAEVIDLPDRSIDIALMLKSLHHVPTALMDQGLHEVARVLRPGGMLYISEPVYDGSFNEILKLFHDEKEVREAAYGAICSVVVSGLLELSEQIFFNSPGHYRDFAHFEERMLNVTHTDHQIDDALYRRIKAAFMQHMGEDGAHFLKP